MESIISGCGKFNRIKDKDLIEARSALVQAWKDDVERAFEKVDKDLPDMMARDIADICYRESEQLKKQTNMERKIGEIFEYNGEWYQCVQQNGCGACPFRKNDTICHLLGCSELVVRDSTPVIFKKPEKVGEPFVIEKVLYQHYKVFDIDNVYGDGFFWCVHNYKARTLTIELKQNKEDMEENHKAEDTLLTRLVGRYVNNLIDYETFEKMGKKLYSDKKDSKPTLKEFDLEAAKAGKPVCTRDGRKARIICFDRQHESNIVALITELKKGGGNKMSYDMDMCDAMTHDNGYCPLREQCKRFILGQKALMEDYHPIYWVEPCYEAGKCELFIEVTEESNG